MSDAVQIHCPHCRNTLRIPADWADRPVRCKFCHQVFMAHRKRAPAATTNAPEPGEGNSIFKPAFVAALVLSGAAGAVLGIGIVLGPALRKMVKIETPSQVAKATDQRAPGVVAETGKNPPLEAGKDKPAAEIVPPTPEFKPPPPEPEKRPPDAGKPPPDQEKKPPDITKVQPEKDRVKGVSPAQLILNELNLLPPATGGKALPVNAATLPEFSPEVLTAYKADYMSILGFRDKEAGYPLRAGIAKTIQALRDNVTTTKMRLTIPGKLMDKQLLNFKNQVKIEQEKVAQGALVLKDLVKELIEIGEKYRAGETPRCQVLFDFTLLRLKARVVHVVEYNFNLAQIRTDSLVQLKADEKLYRLTPQEKVTANEAYIKQYVKDLKKGWAALPKNHPDTPWAVLAPREQEVLLGLTWEPAGEGGSKK
jgi:outer membrane biosynthesis protein TonB